LFKPSETVRKICLEAERVFKSTSFSVNHKKNINFLWNKTKNNLHQFNIYFNKNDYSENISILDTHRDQLTNLIIFKYLDIRMYHELKKKNDTITIRSKYTKLVLFQNQ